MGDLERRLQERSRQQAAQRTTQVTQAAERQRTEEAERQQRLAKARELGREMVELLQKHRVPVMPMWRWKWVELFTVPRHLLTGQEERAEMRLYEAAGEGWRVTSHYVHTSDYAGGATTHYALGTDGVPYTYGYKTSRKYPSLPLALDNPAIAGIVGITDIKDGGHASDNSRELLHVLQSDFFHDGLNSLIHGQGPAQTMYDTLSHLR